MIGDKVLGSLEKFPLQDRALNALLLVATIIGLSASISDALLQTGPPNLIFTFSTALIHAFFYILGRGKPRAKYLVLPFFLTQIIILFFIWYIDGGITGPVMLFIPTLIVVIAVIARSWQKIFLLIISVLVITVLFILELQYPDIYQNFHDKRAETIDTYLFTMMLAGAAYIVVTLVLIRLGIQRNRADALNRSKDKFFSIIAHDLKGPLGAMTQLGEVMWQNQDDLDEKTRKDLLYAMHQSSRQSYNLLTNLLDWARSESGRMEPKVRLLHVTDIVQENLLLLQEKMNAKNLRVGVEIDPSLHVLGDANMISTVVRNLLSNAIKFTPDGGEIHISATPMEAENQVKILFKDSGVGIPPDRIPGLFDLESDFSTEGTNKESGSGLGLKLVHEFLLKNQGDIQVESVEGQGTTFTVSLPTLE